MLRRLFTSTVARLVAAIFVLQLASGAVALALLHSQMLQVIASDRTRQILDVRDDLLAAYYEGGREGLTEFIAARRGSTVDPLIFVAVSGSGPPQLVHLAQVPAVSAGPRPAPVAVVPAPGAEPLDGLAIATDLSDGTRLVVGALTAPDRRFDLAFAEAITVTVLLTIGLALGGALFVGFMISRRTHAIAATAQALAAGDFAARVHNEDHGDGFDHLRQQMNFMAERIDRLVRELQSMAGALAHDLRSPVARLTASIETAHAAVPEGPAAEALQLALSDAAALETMIATALELARLDSGTIGDRRTRLDLAEIAVDLIELYEPLAEQTRTTLAVAAPRPVMALADRELVSRAVANLIDNALKYGGDHIALAVRREGPWGVIEVADNGPGIAESDRARAMDRFSRLDNARTRPGAGLGLAMVSAVAQLHGGTFELAQASGGEGGAGGLLARFRIPGA